MSHIRTTTVQLTSDTAAILTQAARCDRRRPAQGLSDFCGDVLTRLAELLRGYHDEWNRLLAQVSDLPEDIEAEIGRLEMLVGIGATLASFVDEDHLKLEHAIERLEQLSRLDIPVEMVPVIWTPDSSPPGNIHAAGADFSPEDRWD